MGRRLPLAIALAPFGALVAHAAGYGLAPGSHVDHVPHGHLGPAVAAAVPIGCALLLWLACGRRGARHPLPGVPTLAAVQVATFAVQEVVERLAASAPVADLATSPAVRWALAAQVVAAAAVLVAVRAARTTWATVAAALGRRAAGRAGPAAPPPPSPPLASPARPRLASPLSRRGPPAVLAPA